MRKVYVFVLSIFIFSACQKASQPQHAELNLINKEALDRSGNNMHIGRVTFSALNVAPHAAWFLEGKAKYKPKPEVIEELKFFKNDYKITIYGATWCGDTRTELPKFTKILEELNFPSKNYEMYFVHNSSEAYKQTPDANKFQFGIFRVPTFIIEKNGIEVGRIIEEPIKTLEEDLLQILNGAKYTPFFALGNLVEQSLAKGEIDFDNPAFIVKCKKIMKSQNELNGLGYVYMAQKNIENAIKVFKLNTILYPKEPNTYDSLGETYLLLGKKKLAKQAYEKVLSLDPENENAKLKLGKIAL